MASISVPQLQMKLHVLYSLGLNSKIYNHATLAKALKINKSAVSPWVANETIPADRVDSLCDIFGISREKLLLNNVNRETFTQAVAPALIGWDNLLSLAATNNTRLQFVRSPTNGNKVATSAATRVLLHEDDCPDSEEVELFKIDESMRIRVTGYAGWSVVLILQHPGGFQCLYPSARDNGFVIDDSECFYVPQADKYFRVKPPLGMYSVVAVLKDELWQEGVHQLLQGTENQLLQGINSMARNLRELPASSFSVFNQNFWVDY